MATFEATRGQFSQQHFEIIEIDLPVITGVCTLGGSDGYGTPLTCDEAWTGEYKTYSFTNSDLDIPLPGLHWRYIKSISETVTELKPGNGLSSRGSASIVFNDFTGQDPNPDAPAVDDAIKNQGTFFGKLNARQIFVNRAVRIKLYRVQDDGTVDLVNGAQTRNYVTDSLRNNGNGTWTLACKDELSVANIGEKSWPIATNGFLRLDVDTVATALPVDSEVDYSSAQIVRIGDEFFNVTSVTDNQGPTATLNVTRDTAINAPVSGVRLTRNDIEDHSAGDEVFICRISDNESIDSLLYDVLVDSDVDPSLIPAADWADEVSQWQATTQINTLWSQSEKVNDVLSLILESYLMDLWFDPEDSEIKLKAISVWKESSTELIEGDQIRAYSLKRAPDESLRTTRAIVVYDKTYIARSDDVANYNKASKFADDTLINDDLFGKHKDRLFSNNRLLDDNTATLLTQRTVSRFKFTPFTDSWVTDEQKLNFNVGDVVDYQTNEIQGPDGLPSGNARGQIISIKPVYKKDGREYQVKSKTYEPAFSDNTEIVLTSPLSGVNLYLQAGAPSTAVTLTFVLDGTYSFGQNAIVAGAFPTGSKIIIILANGFDGQALGGNGGRGASVVWEGDPEGWVPIPFGEGLDGGVVYDAQGVDTDIYFSGATPSTNYPSADGYIRAPGGGGDGQAAINGDAGDGGGGGAGRPAGSGGAGGVGVGPGATNGIAGTGGDIIGNGGTGFINGGDWGQDTASNLAGSGVIDSGATVTFFGDTPTRYINGNGDH